MMQQDPDRLQLLRSRLARRLAGIRQALPDFAASHAHALAAATCIAAPVPLQQHQQAVQFIGELTLSALLAARARAHELEELLEVLTDLAPPPGQRH
jgi:hypothetical protein